MDYRNWNDRLAFIVQVCTLVAFAGAFVVWLIPDLRSRVGKFLRTRWRSVLLTGAVAAAIVVTCVVLSRPSAGTGAGLVAPGPDPTKPAGPPPAEFSNSAGITFVYLEGGDLHREPAEGGGSRADRAVIRVPGFYISKTPITQKQHRTITGKNPSYFQKSGEGGAAVRGVLDTDEHPVESVTFEDAEKAAAALSGRSEERTAGRTYRIPSEDQYEYACGCRPDEPFPWGAALDSRHANFDWMYPVGAGSSPTKPLRRTTPVTAYPPNGFGLLDAVGNVRVWCASPAGRDRIARGGSWNDTGENCRPATRSKYGPNEAKAEVGYRLVCDVAR